MTPLNIIPMTTADLIYTLSSFLMFMFVAYNLGTPNQTRLKRMLVFLVSSWAVSWVLFGMAGAMSGYNQLQIDLGRPEAQVLDSMYPHQAGTFCLRLFVVATLGFFYTLLERKVDMAFRVLAAVQCISAFMGLVSERFTLGTKPSVILSIWALIIFIYIFSIAGARFVKEKDRAKRQRIGVPILGTMVTIGLWAVFDLVMRNIMGIEPIDIAFVHVVMLFCFIGGLWLSVTRFGLLKIDLAQSSQGLFLNMEDPVLLLNGQDELILANPAAERLFTVEAGQDVRSLLPAYSARQKRFEAQAETEEGSRRYACSLTELRQAEELQGKVLMLRDISREHEVGRMKMDFTSTVSHELRTPLTSILGFARIIQKRLEEVILPVTEIETKKEERAVKQVRNNLGVLVSEGQRLTRLINDVLDISKMESGKLEWKFETASPKVLVDQAVDEIRGEAEQKGLAISVELEDDLPAMVADPGRILQVMGNLLSNAVKFTDEGSIVVAARTTQQGMIDFEIRDTGMGISAEDQVMIFQKYQQVGDVLTDKPKGTGLGLPIAREIVERHGGKISVRSEQDRGSSFHFSLPVAVKDEDVEPISLEEIVGIIERASQHADPVDGHILVVDDENHIRQLLRQSLESEGYRVMEAEDGMAGLDCIREHPISLAIIDVMMPKLNGFDMVAVLKNDPKTMHLPLIMLTVVDDQQRGLGLGVDRYLRKPLGPEAVTEEVSSLLTQKKERTALVLGGKEFGGERLRKALVQGGYRPFRLQSEEDLGTLEGQPTPDLILVENGFSSPNELVAKLRASKISTMQLRFVEP
jgi:signal transduction histidine kinase/CheY-like chemotaxis protein